MKTTENTDLIDLRYAKVYVSTDDDDWNNDTWIKYKGADKYLLPYARDKLKGKKYFHGQRF